jgi:hypothetical protein
MARSPHPAAFLSLVLLASACGAGTTGSAPPAAPVAPAAPAAGPAGEHAVTFVFADEMGSAFRIERLDVALDGRPLYVKAAATGLAEKRQLVLARDLPLPGGEHALDLQLVFRGHGEGVFAYLKGYTFRVKSRHVFQAQPGLVVAIHARERPDGPLEQRPFVQFEEGFRADR